MGIERKRASALIFNNYSNVNITTVNEALDAMENPYEHKFQSNNEQRRLLYLSGRNDSDEEDPIIEHCLLCDLPRDRHRPPVQREEDADYAPLEANRVFEPRDFPRDSLSLYRSDRRSSSSSGPLSDYADPYERLLRDLVRNLHQR